MDEIQVYASGTGIEAGWATLIALATFLTLSCGVRYARDDQCTICGRQLIWFRRVCLPCHFYGYVPPSKDVEEIIQEKRSVVLPEPTLSERIGTVKAATTKVFVQATEVMLPSKTLSRINVIRDGAKSWENSAGEAAARIASFGRGEKDIAAPGAISGGLRAMSSARSVAFIADIEEDSSSKHPWRKGKFKTRVGSKNSSRVVAAQDSGSRKTGGAEETHEGSPTSNQAP